MKAPHEAREMVDRAWVDHRTCVARRWQSISRRSIRASVVHSGTGSANAPSSRVQLWVDRQLVIDHKKAMINGGSSDGDGLGSFLASTDFDEQGRHAGD
jgi:hypothetical protein